jgi:serine/threonine protein kinase
MFDTDTLYLERLGTKCGRYQLDKVLAHDSIRTCYQVSGPEQDQYELQLFQEGFYAGESVHSSIETFVRSLQQKLPDSLLRIVDVGFSGHAEPYVVTPKLGADQLSAILAHRRVIGIDECLRLGILASQALHEMHKNGFVHGCLSPKSIWVDSDKVIIADVAVGHIAALASKPGSESVGIPLYMSAEQLDGGAATIESDTYALALILYECITGLPPQSSATITELALHRRKTIPSLTSATDRKQPPELEVFFKKALSSRQSNRYADAQDLNEALLSVQRRDPIAPPFDLHKIPHRYKILKHPSTTNLTELQRVDGAACQREIRANKQRNKLVNGFFIFCAVFAATVYLMTLSCLASMHQDIQTTQWSD